MKHYLLNHQPQKGLQAACAQQGQAPTCNARGKGRTSASPKTLTKVILVLLTMFLIPSATWADYTYGGQPLTFYYPNDSDPSYYYSGSENNKDIEWNAQLTNGAYNSSYSGYSAFSELRFTYANSITGLLSNIAIAGSTGSALQSATIKVYRLAAPDATDRTQIGTISNEGTTYTYNPTEVVQGFNNEYIQLAIEPEEGKTNQCFYVNNINSITLTFSGEEYGISVGGHRVTSYNANNVLGDATSSSVSFDAENKKLTLNGASISSDIISSLEALTINLEGTNTLSGSISYSGSASNRTLAFSGSGSLGISSNGLYGAIYSFTGVDFGNFNLATPTAGTYYAINPKFADLVGALGTMQFNNEFTPTYNITITKDIVYPLWIAKTSASTYTQVTDNNKDNVLSDNTVTFDGQSLTLSGASLTGSIISGLSGGLTIKVNGTNTININLQDSVSCIRNYAKNATLTLQKYSSSTSECSLLLTGPRGQQVKDFSSINYSEGGLYLTAKDGETILHDAYYSGGSFSSSSGNVSSVIFSSEEPTDLLWLGNTPIGTSGTLPVTINASETGDDIEGDGSVTFNVDENNNNILTLNNVSISGSISSALDNLTILIIGKSNSSYSIISTKNDATLTFKTETFDDMLSISTEYGAAISGFASVEFTKTKIIGWGTTIITDLTYQNNEIKGTDINSYEVIGFLNGKGTEANPYLIEGPEDLNAFSLYVKKGYITTEYVQLYQSIDCNELEGFTPIGNSGYSFAGTFDGNNKTISGLNCTPSGGDAGLFGSVGNANISSTIIKNLNLDNCTFNGADAGAIAITLNNGIIQGCHVTSSSVTSHQQSPKAGGIVASLGNGSIEGCSVSESTVTGKQENSGNNGVSYAGGIAGSTSGGSINNCEVTNVNIISSHIETNGPLGSGGIVGYASSTTITNNTVGGTTTVTCENKNSAAENYTNAGAIVGYHYHPSGSSGCTFNSNTYESSVKTITKENDNTEETKEGQTQRGIGQDIGQENGSYDIPNQVMMAGTKKVNISVTGLSGDRTLSLGEMEDTYCLDERDASTGQLTALYVLPNNNVSLIVRSENGYKPTFALSDNDVKVTPTEEYENDFWTIKYDFKMPEDDVTATIAFAKDLESKNGDAFIYTLSAGQEAYPYTGEAIEPSISLTTDPQTPATLTKGTDYEIKDYFEVKEGVATPMYEEDGTTPKAPINVGSYKISITGKGNYFGTRELEFTIAKSAVDWSDNRWVAPEAKTDLKYTGADMELVTAATVPEGVTIKYYAKYSSTAFNSYDYSASQNEEWSEEVPTGKEIGYYAVFYKVEGGDNYLDWGPSEVGIDVNIDKGEVTISAEAQTVTYNTKQQAYTGASVDNENVTRVIAYYTSEEDRTNALNALTGAPTDAGTYYVSVTLNEESQQHYTAEPANVTFTIAQLDIADAVITLDKEELTYNGEEQSVTVTKVMVGDIEVPIDCYEVSGNTKKEAGSYTLTVTAKLKNSDGSDFKNNFTSSAKKAWKINHRTIPAEVIAEKFTSEGQTYATFYDASESFLAPQGIVAYIITGVSGSSVTVKAVSYIKAGIPVLLQKTSTSTETEETTDDIFATNILKYAEGNLTANGGQYVLYKNEFVKATGSITSGKCYLDLTGTSFAGTRGFSIAGGAEGTTAISDAVVDSDHSEWFDLQGRKIEKPSKKGLYIRDGKKIVVK